MILSPNIIELWEALIAFSLFFILIIVAYLVDIKVWKHNKTFLNEEYQIDDADEKRNDDIDTYLKKFASEMELANNMVLSLANLLSFF